MAPRWRGAGEQRSQMCAPAHGYHSNPSPATPSLLASRHLLEGEWSYGDWEAKHKGEWISKREKTASLLPRVRDPPLHAMCVCLLLLQGYAAAAGGGLGL